MPVSHPLGLVLLRAGRLAPATQWLVLSMLTSQLFDVGGIYNALFSLLSSFAAMDGVPFMISEKFSCVPESVSVVHDFPSLPPPRAELPLPRGAVACRTLLVTLASLPH